MNKQEGRVILEAVESPTWIPDWEKVLPFLIGSILAALSLTLGSLLMNFTWDSMYCSFFFFFCDDSDTALHPSRILSVITGRFLSFTFVYEMSPVLIVCIAYCFIFSSLTSDEFLRASISGSSMWLDPESGVLGVEGRSRKVGGADWLMGSFEAAGI